MDDDIQGKITGDEELSALNSSPLRLIRTSSVTGATYQPSLPVNGVMCPVAYPDREKPSEESSISRLTRFIDESDLSFYQIASLIGTSGTILSMWLAGTAKPGAAELVKIERFLKAITTSR